jgi:hypothetical protein
MWIITAWQPISPEVILKGVKKFCMCSTVDETYDDSCGMAVNKMGMLGVSVGKIEALTVKIESNNDR